MNNSQRKTQRVGANPQNTLFLTFGKIRKNKKMKSVKALALIVAASFTFTLSHAQTVEELQQKYFDALGGKAKLATLKNVYQEANMAIMGMEMPSKMWIVFGAAMRQEIEVQGQKIITFINSNSGWSINPMMGAATAQPLPEEAVKEYAGAVLVPGGQLASYKEYGYTASYEGKEDVDGKPAYKIRLAKDSSESFFYIDVATNYLTKNVTKANAMGQQTEVTTTFSDYKKTPEGYVFPYTSVINNPMIGEIKATLTKLEVNQAVDVKELEKQN